MRNITPQQLSDLVRSPRAESLSADARERLSWIAFFVDHHGSMQETCEQFKIARSTLHRWLERFDPENLATLEEGTHVPYTVRQPMVPARVVSLIRTYRERWPLIGKEKISLLLKEHHGFVLSGSSVGRVIDRECLYFADTPLHWRKRLEGRVAMHTPHVETAPVHTAVAPVTASHAHVDLRDERPLPQRIFRRTGFFLSLIAHGLALAFVVVVLWEVSHTKDQQASALSPDRVIESLDSPSISTNE